MFLVMHLAPSPHLHPEQFAAAVLVFSAGVLITHLLRLRASRTRD